MVRFGNRGWLALLLGGLLTLSSARPASASFQFRISVDGGSFQTVDWATDAGSATDSATGAKQISYTGSFSVTGGTLNISAIISTSNNTSGADDYGNIARIEIGGLRINNGGSSDHTIVLQASDQGFTFPSPPPLYIHTTESATVTNTKGKNAATVNVVGSVDTGNALFGDNFDTGSGQTLTFKAGQGLSSSVAGDLTTNSGFTPTDSSGYSLTNTMTIHVSNRTNVNSAGSTVEVITPAPAGFLLACTGVPLLGAFHWLRRRKK